MTTEASYDVLGGILADMGDVAGRGVQNQSPPAERVYYSPEDPGTSRERRRRVDRPKTSKKRKMSSLALPPLLPPMLSPIGSDDATSRKRMRRGDDDVIKSRHKMTSDRHSGRREKYKMEDDDYVPSDGEMRRIFDEMATSGMNLDPQVVEGRKKILLEKEKICKKVMKQKVKIAQQDQQIACCYKEMFKVAEQIEEVEGKLRQLRAKRKQDKQVLRAQKRKLKASELESDMSSQKKIKLDKAAVEETPLKTGN